MKTASVTQNMGHTAVIFTLRKSTSVGGDIKRRGSEPVDSNAQNIQNGFQQIGNKQPVSEPAPKTFPGRQDPHRIPAWICRHRSRLFRSGDIFSIAESEYA